MDQNKLEAYLTETAEGKDTHLEVRRFIKDLLLKIEFGHFEGEEDEVSSSEFL